MTDEQFIPTEILEHIASYNQLPKLSSVSRTFNQIEDSLHHFRDELMDKDFPNWKYQRDVPSMLYQLGSGSLDLLKYYIQNSKALWEYLQQFIPIELVVRGAIDSHNLILLEDLLTRYHLKDEDVLFASAMKNDDIEALELLSKHYYLPDRRTMITNRMSQAMIHYIISHAALHNLPNIFLDAIRTGMPDNIIYDILDRFPNERLLQLQNNLYKLSTELTPRAEQFIFDELQTRGLIIEEY